MCINKFYPPTETKPTMPQLIELQCKNKSINVAEAIGDQWRMVGIALLNDESGAIIKSIGDQFRGDARNINLEILQRWIRGEGIPDRTWRGLLHVLRVHCVSLAESVEEAMTAEEAEQGKSGHTHLIVTCFINTSWIIRPSVRVNNQIIRFFAGMNVLIHVSGKKTL